MASCKCEGKAATADQQPEKNCCSFEIDCQCPDGGECVCTALVTCGLEEDGGCCKVECLCEKEGGCKCRISLTGSNKCTKKDGCSCKVKINCEKGGKKCCQCVHIVKGTGSEDCKIECEKPDPTSGCVCECKFVDLAPGEKGCCKVKITCTCK